jgi:hypothetical protein
MYLTPDDVIAHVKAQLAAKKKTQKQYAKELGLAETFLADVLKGRRPLGPRMLQRFGFDPTPHYKRAAKQ